MKLGNLDIKNFNLGENQVKKIYLGNDLVWQYAQDLLLDLFPNATVAYSLDKLRFGYTGSAIRVRRSSDNTEINIGFVNNALDTATLLAFCGAGSGFVTTIYDQVGSNNMIQTLATRQGRIVVNGVLNTLNGKPIILRSVDSNGGYLNSSLNFTADTNVYGLYYAGIAGNTLGCIFGSNDGGADYGYVFQQGSTSTTVNNLAVPSNQKLNGNNWIYSTRGNVYNSLVNQFLLTAGMQFNFVISGYSLGYRFNIPSNLGMAGFQEHILYPNTNNQLLIQDNINSRYNIY
jgi:hypothetical protein